MPVAALPDGPAAAVTATDGELWSRVRRLPERQRVAVGLRYALDLSHAEIATALGCTQTTSRRLVSDGLAALRAELRSEQ